MKAQVLQIPSCSSPSPIEFCRTIFGEHPEDLIAAMEQAAKTLNSLQTIFGKLSDDLCNAEEASPEALSLTSAGSYLASEAGTFLSQFGESVADHLHRYLQPDLLGE